MRTKLDNQSTYITASRNTQLHLRQQHSEVSRASTKHDNRLHNTKHRSRFFLFFREETKTRDLTFLRIAFYGVLPRPAGVYIKRLHQRRDS